MSFGILAFGAYLPRLRLSRKAIAEANGWFNPALKAQGKGERAMCNWDEDVVTMAVEAARDALAERDRASIAAVRFASTTTSKPRAAQLRRVKDSSASYGFCFHG